MEEDSEVAVMKKLRKEFFHFQPDDNTLRLWDPYLRISIVKPKKTFSGLHDTKVMISIGRRFNKEKADEFFKSDDPAKEEILKRFAKEMNQPLDKVIEVAKAGMLKNIMLKIWKKSAEKLGIPVIIPEKEKYFEVFEYIKVRDPDEIMQIIRGLLLALGVAIGLFVKKNERDLKIDMYKFHLINRFESIVKKGVEIANNVEANNEK